VLEREEERARLARGGAPVEEQRERRRGGEQPEEVHRLCAAPRQRLEECVDRPLPLSLLLLLGGPGAGEELAPGRGFGPRFGRGGIGCGAGCAARSDGLRHRGSGRVEGVGTLGGEWVGGEGNGERRAGVGEFLGGKLRDVAARMGRDLVGRNRFQRKWAEPISVVSW
jgi:hypothetical protein